MSYELNDLRDVFQYWYGRMSPMHALILGEHMAKHMPDACEKFLEHIEQWLIAEYKKQVLGDITSAHVGKICYSSWEYGIAEDEDWKGCIVIYFRYCSTQSWSTVDNGRIIVPMEIFATFVMASGDTRKKFRFDHTKLRIE